MPRVYRPRTAIARNRLSLPARIALDDRVITSDTTVLDYGCGRGDDVNHLTAQGISAHGWDPHYCPEPAPTPADVVLLTYVLNTIEDLNERKATLHAALRLARRCLVASTRLRWEERSVRGEDYHDGVVTGRGTFQALHRPEEFRLWTRMVTGIQPISPCPEAVYLFTDAAAQTSHIHQRYRKATADDDPGLDPLQRLANHLQAYGRAPRPYELPEMTKQLEAAYGSITRATTAAQHLTNAGTVAAVARRRKNDLVVALAMDTFHGRPPLNQLPPSTIADIRTFFGNYRNAYTTAEKLLLAAGNPELIKRAAHSSRTGKLTPTALYVHTSALDRLPPLLRIYEACARIIAGTPEDANLIKLHHDQPAVSYLTYPDFNADPHPRLAASLFVQIANQKTRWADYHNSINRPLLHRKEEFVGADHPDAARWRRLTKQEIAHGLYNHPSRIGTEQGWSQVLAAQGVELRGHRLVRRKASL
jgi:DNA phosphorothioation-associated putative methyltransferase